MGLAALLLLPYWLIQGLRHGKYLSNLSERLGFSFPSLGQLPARQAWSNLDSRGVGRRGAFRRRARAKIEASLSGAAANHFDDDHHRAGTGATSECLLPTRSFISRSTGRFACAARYERFGQLGRGSLETEIWPNFLRRSWAPQDSGRLRQRTDFGSIICSIPELFAKIRILPAALSSERPWQRQRFSDAEPGRCRPHPRARRTGRPRQCQRQSEIRSSLAFTHAAFSVGSKPKRSVADAIRSSSPEAW